MKSKEIVIEIAILIGIFLGFATYIVIKPDGTECPTKVVGSVTGIVTQIDPQNGTTLRQPVLIRFHDVGSVVGHTRVVRLNYYSHNVVDIHLGKYNKFNYNAYGDILSVEQMPENKGRLIE